MAYKIDRLENSKGRVSWRVRWRFGGTRDGAWQSVTLASKTDAIALKAGVDTLRDRITRDDPRIVDRSIITGVRATQPADTSPLWADVAQEWLKTRSVRATTLHQYEQIVSDHLSRWDERSIASLERVDVVTFVNDYQITRGGQGKTSYMLVVAILDYAISKGLRHDNPARKIKLHTAGESIAVFLDADELDMLREAASNKCFPTYWPVLLEATMGTGLRQSEVLALQTRDLTLTEGHASIRVRRAWRPVSGKGHQITPPKSASSLRVIAITDDLADMLRDFVRDRKPTDFLFTDKPSTPLGSVCRRRWGLTVELARAEGLAQQPRFHDLRHSHASDLLMRGVPMIVVSRRLGHSGITITDQYYGHLSADSDDVVRAAMSNPERGIRRLRAV